jgi:hypothetical protein
MSIYVTQVLDYDYDPESDFGTVTAVIEDFVLVYPQTYECPAEYGPGMAKATFSLEEGEEIPKDETELEMFFEEKGLNWKPVDE